MTLQMLNRDRREAIALSELRTHGRFQCNAVAKLSRSVREAVVVDSVNGRPLSRRALRESNVAFVGVSGQSLMGHRAAQEAREPVCLLNESASGSLNTGGGLSSSGVMVQ